MRDQAANNREGSDFQLTGSFLVSFLAFEAFINFLGGVVAPDAWEDERTYFSGRNGYKGILGKVEKLCDELGIAYDKSSDPFASVVKSKETRDRISHGKLVEYSEEQEIDPIDPARFNFFRLEWSHVLTVEQVDRARTQIEALAEKLRAAAAPKFSTGELHLLHKAFQGSLGNAMSNSPYRPS